LLYLLVAEVPLFAAQGIPFWKQTFVIFKDLVHVCTLLMASSLIYVGTKKDWTGHHSRLRVFKRGKTDSLFLEEYFLSKQNVKHPYLISLEFRSTKSNILN